MKMTLIGRFLIIMLVLNKESIAALRGSQCSPGHYNDAHTPGGARHEGPAFRLLPEEKNKRVPFKKMDFVGNN